jgi:hypothetical protein
MKAQAIFFRVLRLIASEFEQAGIKLFEVTKEDKRIVITFF